MVSSWVLKILLGLTIVYTIALTVGSLVKPVEIDVSVSHFDKILHTGAYGGLAFLWLSVYQLYSCRKRIFWSTIGKYILIMVLITIFGILIELLQGGTTDYRTADIWDALANTTGVLLGTIIFVIFFKKFMKLKSRN